MKEKISIGSESETLEFKKSTGELKEGLISISSMLNKHGQGTVYFGVDNDGTVLGQQVSEKTLREISNEIGQHIAPQISPQDFNRVNRQ